MTILTRVLAGLSVLLLAAPLSLFAGPEPTRMSREDARGFAISLLRQGQPSAAQTVAPGLLTADPSDAIALNTLAQAELELGDLEAAEKTARRAYRVSDDDTQNFTAAFTVAGALSRQGKLNGAQLWLRRAGGATEDPRQEATARHVFRGVKSANPLRISGTLNFEPSSNVNNGSENAEFVVNGITLSNPAARPLEGFMLDTGFSVQRDISRLLRGDASLSLGLAAQDSRVFLTEDAKESATPELRNEVVSSSAVELSLESRWPGEADGIAFGAALSHGRTWRAGAPLLDTARLSVSRDQRLTSGNTFGTTLSYTRETRQDAASLSADIWRLGARHGRHHAKGALLFDVGVTHAASESALVDRREVAAFAPYAHGEDVLGVLPTLSARATRRDYSEVSGLFGALRDDFEVSLGLELALPRFDAMGLIPTVTVTARRDASSIPACETETLVLRFGYRSTF